MTLCRTAVEFDYRGDIIDRHEPEAPTRFAKQLVQMFRGGVAIGMARQDALRLALRCARDSMPPLRLAVLEDVANHPHSKTSDVARRLDKPRNTVDRQLQALQMLERTYGFRRGARGDHSLAVLVEQRLHAEDAGQQGAAVGRARQVAALEVVGRRRWKM